MKRWSTGWMVVMECEPEKGLYRSCRRERLILGKLGGGLNVAR